ncbi:hypothetical protein HGRIS_001909 [Hohenbuehelia grisea]|uniref:Ankyrin n=1 Tax=Hohenbuehelia grisea TaxID=104357 RepID=A0ABR3JIU9_9AGAR
MATPTTDDQEELLLSCRYGELDDVKEFVTKFGAEALADVRDANGNCVLHMACGNGHLDLLNYLLPLVPATLLAARNEAQSTPLHWAAVNAHLDIAQVLVKFSGGPGVDLIDIKNAAGRTPLGEAELAGWDEGATWLVQMMKLDSENNNAENETDPVEGEDTLDATAVQDMEVEIEDADGGVAKMTISGGQ